MVLTQNKVTSEKQLLLQLIDRKEGAWHDLVTRFSDRIFRLCMRYTRNSDDAEELVQEVFICVYNSIHRFEGRSSLSTWIYSITRNSCLAFLQKKKNRRSEVLSDSGLSEDGIDASLRTGHRDWPEEITDPLLRQEVNHVIWKAIEELPDVFRDIYILKEIEKVSISTIAARFNLSEPAVKTRLHRARLWLRTALRDYFDTFR